MRIVEIAKWTSFGELRVIFEASDRADKLIEEAFQNFNIEEGGKPIPVECYFMPKAANEPGLEVADFIMHAVGRQARKNLTQRDGFVPDFSAVFHSVDRKLTSFIEVASITKNDESNPTGLTEVPCTTTRARAPERDRATCAAMNAPRDHHFIPAFYLKQWADTNGKLIEYTRKGGKLIPKPVGPRSTGYVRDLYAFPELPSETAQYLEQVFFAYADQKASDALDNHLGVASFPWTSELVTAWSRFVLAIHLRHPDAMPELREAAKNIWDASGVDYQARYEAVRKSTDPPTFDEYLALRDPLTPVKMRVNLIMKAFDNEIVCTHVNQMKFAIVDISAAPHRLLTSDRPVQIFNLKESNGLLSIPISPTKIFVAVNDGSTLDKLRRVKPSTLVSNINTFVVSRARRFIWAQDTSQERFIANRMSTETEPTPLFPDIGRYEPPPPTTALTDLAAP
jgi:hypothetical protein